MKKVIELITKYNTIIIHRHSRPDMDAIGSQIGLQELIINNFPNKNVYIVGDLSNMSYKAKMDDITDETYKNALAIIIDTSVDYMVSDERYKLAKDLLIIDHHKNETNLNPTYFYHKPTYTSACEMVIEILKKNKYKVSQRCATYLYTGLVTDTGRFNFINEQNASHCFLMASFITKYKPEIKDIYEFLYTENLEKRLSKNLFVNFKLTKNNVAYRINDKKIIEESKLSFFDISRGMVSLMAGIKEVRIWANFTYDVENNKIVGEFRSRGITIVDIAKEFGGGGHNEACGATLNSLDDVYKILDRFDERILENETHLK